MAARVATDRCEITQYLSSQQSCRTSRQWHCGCSAHRWTECVRQSRESTANLGESGARAAASIVGAPRQIRTLSTKRPNEENANQTADFSTASVIRVFSNLQQAKALLGFGSKIDNSWNKS
jgi:hypothetical protein